MDQNIIHAFFMLFMLPLCSVFAVMVFAFVKETHMARLVSVLSLVMLCGGIGAAFIAFAHGLPLKHSLVFTLPFLNQDVTLALLYDQTSLIFSLLTFFFGYVITHFSKIYLHHEPGYARFFIFLFLLILAMQLLAIADHLLLFFCGWELLGFASYFLISFYRTAEGPRKNALKVFTVYRVGDFGFLGALLFWDRLEQGREILKFSSLAELSLLNDPAQSFALLMLASGVVLAAAAKSGQFPFSSWVPKAMEGPTPSSAIFYGALSIHGGVLLLLRTFPAWQYLVAIKVLVILLGLSSVVYASLLGRIQSSIKAQLAYASVAQVGLMFVEVALGFTHYALIHLTLHALWRAYQIMVSPSSILYFLKSDSSVRSSNFTLRIFGSRFTSSLFVLAFHEFYLGLLWGRFLGRLKQLLQVNYLLLVTVLLSCICISFTFWSVPLTSCLMGGFIVVAWWFSAYAVTTTPLKAFDAVLLSILSIYLAAGLITMDARFLVTELSLIIPFWIICRVITKYFEATALQSGYKLQGMFELRPVQTWLLVLSSCALLGVPLAPSFFVEETVLQSLINVSLVGTILVTISFALNGVALFRAMAGMGMGMVLERADRTFQLELSSTVPVHKHFDLLLRKKIT